MISSSLACLFAALISSGSASAPLADVFVDVNAANCASGTGTLTDPVCSIGAAIALAAPGDTIRIAAGTYVENVALDKDLELIGTDGALVTIVERGSPGRVITVGATVTAIIDGLTVTEGLLAGSGTGVAADAGADLTLRNSTIAGLSGLGVAGSSATMVIETCEISNNDRGVSVFETSLTIVGSTISNNIYTYEPYYAIGLSASASDLTIVDTTISNNYGYKGGGIRMRNGTLIMTGSTVSDNEASRGGGLYFFSTDFEITNSTISNNKAGFVGGLLFQYGPGCLTNVTVTENVGARAAVYGREFPSVELSHSIVAGSALGNGTSTYDVSGAVGLSGHNVVGAVFSTFGNGVNGNHFGTLSNPVAPYIGPLQDNGGPTETHALLFGSPAIDAGDFATAALLDQRGFARSSGTAPDIGAYEFDIAEVSLCSGDGGDQLGCTNCPCGNNAVPGTVGGCLNSAGNSAVLSASGSLSASVPPMSNLDLRLTLSGLPALKFSLLTSGSAVAPANIGNPCVGLNSGLQSMDRDGLRCAVMNIKRHGGRSADMLGEIMDSTGPSRVWGGEAQPHGGLWKQGGFASGQTRYFQAIYREHPTSGCMRGLNTSQAVEVEFTP